MSKPCPCARRERAAFTLLELIVVMAILAILATAAVPLTTKMLHSKARGATESEMRGLSDAAAAYFRDTARLPTSLAQLVSDPGLAGWTGPYIGSSAVDKISGQPAHAVDAWSQPYQITIAGDTYRIVSSGADGQAGSTDDLRLDLSVTYIRRQVTLDELVIINQAVTLYNAQYLVSSPLPTNWNQALSRLVATGFLPTAGVYRRDGWNRAYVADPAGRMPVVKITSVNLR